MPRHHQYHSSTRFTEPEGSVTARASAIGLIGALAIAASILAPVAQAALSSKPARTFVTNGRVEAVLPTPGAIYIGGSFTLVGPRTGPGVGIDSSTAKSTGLPEVSGGWQELYAVTPDGSGGFYIGGDFTHVGGVVRHNLAHILANGSVDPNFNPNVHANANVSVQALALSGSTVYAGGDFSSIGGRTRFSIAALGASSGAATSWNPNLNSDSTVDALAVSGSTVYAGGGFRSVGGKTRHQIAALDASSGTATSWNPNANNIVHALAVSGSTVYAGGYLSSIGGKNRNQIAALNATSGAATSWNPNANGIVDTLAVGPDGSLWAGGSFTGFARAPQSGIARFKP